MKKSDLLVYLLLIIICVAGFMAMIINADNINQENAKKELSAQIETSR